MRLAVRISSARSMMKIAGLNPPTPLQHGVRAAEIKSTGDPLAKLKLPPAHDKKAWNAVDVVLSEALATELPASVFSSLGASILSSKLSKCIYSVLHANFAVEEK